MRLLRAIRMFVRLLGSKDYDGDAVTFRRAWSIASAACLRDSKPSPFDSADLYSCMEDDEELIWSDPEDAISCYVHNDCADYQDGVTVYAFRRVPVTEDWVSFASERLSETLVETFEDEYGGDSPGVDECSDQLSAKLLPVVKWFIGQVKPWTCEYVASREYTQNEVRGILDEDD